MFYKVILTAVLLSVIFLPEFCLGQGRHILTIPKRYLTSPGEVLRRSLNRGDYHERILWTVCSDRVNNPTFTDPAGRTPFRQMGFMDRFFVTDENDRFLHLFKYDEQVEIENRLTPGAVDYGWAEKTKLLLWSRCIVTDKQLGVKAFIAVNSNRGLVGPLGGYGPLKMYSDPGLAQENTEGTSPKIFQLLYIYKQEGNSVLISKAYRSNFFNIKSDVLGWVSNDIVQRWDNSVCLEPNIEAGDNRKQNNIKASIFSYRDYVAEWKKGDTPKPIWDDDEYANKLNPYTKRFPIFSEEGGIITTGVVTDILDRSDNVLISKKTHDSLDQALNKQTTDIRKVNIVFVIDAGQGFEQYIGAVEAAIQKMADNLADGLYNENDNFRYGAVVYRDYGDSNCPQGDLSIDKFDLTFSIRDLTDWLVKQAAIKGCRQHNKALNLGLHEALRMIASRVNADESNFMVLIGGEANSRPNQKYTDEAIAKQIADTKTNLLALQVVRGHGIDFDNFVVQLHHIISGANNIAFNNDRSSAGNSFNVGQAPVTRILGDNSYGNDYPGSTQLQGSIAPAPADGQLPADSVISRVNEFVNFNNADIDRKADALTGFFEGAHRRSARNLDASLMRYMVALGTKLNNMGLVARYLDNDTYQFFEKGYTTAKVDGLDTPVFKKVLFLNATELDDLITALRPLTVPTTLTEERVRITGAFITVIEAYCGDFRIKENISNMTAAQVTELIKGIPSGTPFFKNHAIGDFRNSAIVSDDEIRQMVRYLQSKVNDLEMVRVNQDLAVKYDWGFYYWVPEEYMP